MAALSGAQANIVETLEGVYDVVSTAELSLAGVTNQRAEYARAVREGDKERQAAALDSNSRANNPFSALLRWHNAPMIETAHMLEALQGLAERVDRVRTTVVAQLPDDMAADYAAADGDGGVRPRLRKVVIPAADGDGGARPHLHKVVIPAADGDGGARPRRRKVVIPDDDDDIEEVNDDARGVNDEAMDDVDGGVNDEEMLAVMESFETAQAQRRVSTRITADNYAPIVEVLAKKLRSMRKRLETLLQELITGRTVSYDKATLVGDLSMLAQYARAARDKIVLVERAPGTVTAMATDAQRTTLSFAMSDDMRALLSRRPLVLVDEVFGNVWNAGNRMFQRIDAVAGGPNGRLVVLDTKMAELSPKDPRRAYPWVPPNFDRPIAPAPEEVLYEDRRGHLSQFLHMMSADGTPHAGDWLKQQLNTTVRSRILDVAADPANSRVFLVDDSKYRHKGTVYASYITALVDKPAKDGRVFKRGKMYGKGVLANARSLCYVDDVTLGAYNGPAIFAVMPVQDGAGAPVVDAERLRSHSMRIVAFPVNACEDVSEACMEVGWMLDHAVTRPVLDHTVTNLWRANPLRRAEWERYVERYDDDERNARIRGGDSELDLGNVNTRPDEEWELNDAKLRRVPTADDTVRLSLLDVSSSTVVILDVVNDFVVDGSGVLRPTVSLVQQAHFGVGVVNSGGTDTSGAANAGPQNVSGTIDYGEPTKVLPPTIGANDVPRGIAWLRADRLVVADTPRRRLQIYSWAPGKSARLLWNVHAASDAANVEPFHRLGALGVDTFGRLLVADHNVARPHFDRRVREGVVYQLRLNE